MKLMTTILTFLVCAYTGNAAGQIDPQPKASDNKGQEQPMEEITVIGQRSLGTLRVQIDKAEDRMFDIFNKLNTDDLYDIHCRRVAPIGSRIKRKTCSPEYFDRTEAETSQLALTGVPVGASYMNAKLTRYNKTMGAKWKQLVMSNPELLHALIEHYELSQKLKQQRRAYFGVDE